MLHNYFARETTNAVCNFDAVIIAIEFRDLLIDNIMTKIMRFLRDGTSVNYVILNGVIAQTGGFFKLLTDYHLIQCISYRIELLFKDVSKVVT